MKVINLAGGPGIGKSTTAAGLFSLMKQMGHKVELVTEVAKDLTYEENWRALSNQLLVTAKQEERLHRLRKHGLDFVISDSPLFLGLAYCDDNARGWLEGTVRGIWNAYNNYTFILPRKKPYADYGRKESEQKARELDLKIKDIAAHITNQHCFFVPHNEETVRWIYEAMCGKIGKVPEHLTTLRTEEAVVRKMQAENLKATKAHNPFGWASYDNGEEQEPDSTLKNVGGDGIGPLEHVKDDPGLGAAGTDMVNLPAHYAKFKIEPISFIGVNELNWFQGNIIKYAARAPFKHTDGGLQDIKKIIRYAVMWREFVRGNADWWKSEPKGGWPQ